MTTIIALIGQNLAKLREDKGFTQASLAKMTGISRGTIARYESGEGGIDAKTIAKLAKALDIEEIDLVKSLGSIKVETVELPKEHWEKLNQRLASLSIPDPIAQHLSSPAIRKIVEILSTLDEGQRKTILSDVEDFARRLPQQGVVSQKKHVK